MSVLQYYYTSFVHPQTYSAGFQVKALSPGISPEIQALLARLIAYRMPALLDERDIQVHPVALRYYYVNQRECILLCSQSNGNDETGRPGNFFAHVLILEPEMFKTLPPIFFWQSPFWLNQDREVRSQPDVLPVLPAFEKAPSLDFARVWTFLTTVSTAQVIKLLSATVHSGKTFRRVVIVDTTEHIALWIALVSSLLPPDYRPLLSFATYHHDPRQGQFMITGTTSDSAFRNTAEDYFTYFVINAETQRISDIEPSAYAELAGSIENIEQYEAQMLPFFALIERRFGHVLQQREQVEQADFFEELDVFALYFWLVQGQFTYPLSQREWQAIDQALKGFEQLSAYDEDSLADLEHLRRVLNKIQTSGEKNAQCVQSVQRLTKALKLAGN